MVNISSVAGRMTRKRAAASNLTKHGVGAFSDALRQEVTLRHVRVSLVEPGAVETELTGGRLGCGQTLCGGRTPAAKRDRLADSARHATSSMPRLCIAIRPSR
jgi:NADP-dependent 3-hydroxy acid dehydrogenase YdfG